MPLPAGLVAERRLIERLMRAGAMAPDAAQPLTDLRHIERRRLPRLVARGVIREHGPDRYYLDGPALANYLRSRRRSAIVALFILVVLAMLFALGMMGEVAG
jgi:hypothetical protein